MTTGQAKAVTNERSRSAARSVSRDTGIYLLTTAGLFFSFVTTFAWPVVTAITALLLIGYALLTLRRLTQRKRPITDATVWFWRVGLVLLMLSMLLTLVTLLTDIPVLQRLNYLFFTGFALSIVFAMFYKIVPFLTWFHLNAQGYFTAPMMHEVIHPRTAMKHLYIHLSTLTAFVLSLLFSPLIYLAGVLTLLSFGWIGWQIVHAWKLYLHTQKTGEKFEMNLPNT